jgi:hypothetical protein
MLTFRLFKMIFVKLIEHIRSIQISFHNLFRYVVPHNSHIISFHFDDHRQNGYNFCKHGDVYPIGGKFIVFSKCETNYKYAHNQTPKFCIMEAHDASKHKANQLKFASW